MILRVIKLSMSLGVSLSDHVLRRALTLLAREPPPVWVVLYYHGIPSERRGCFARQMDELVRISTPVRADHEQPLQPGRRYAAVTFDDGFVSVVENALPELRSRRIPCTLFVPTGSLGTRPSWIRDRDAGGHLETVVSQDVIEALRAEDLITIGSHSITHRDFRMLDDERARIELETSKFDLEAILKKGVGLFSFPHGACTQRGVELARRAGYRRVYTIDPVLAPTSGDQFVCGRVRVDPGDWALEFRLKAQGAYRWLSRASLWKKRLRHFLGRSERRSSHEA